MNFWRFTFIRDKRLCHPSDLILYVLGYLSVTSHSNHQNQKLPTSLPHGLPLCVSPFCKKHRSFPRSSRFTVWGRIRVFPLQPAAPAHHIRSVSSRCCFVSLCCRSGSASTPQPPSSPVLLKLLSRNPWESPRTSQGVMGSKRCLWLYEGVICLFHFLS